MKNHLLGIRPRLAIAGLIGLVAAVALYRPGLGAPVAPYPRSEAEILAAAREFVSSHGLEPAASARASAVTFRGDYAKIARQLGVVEAHAAAESGELETQTWRVRFRDKIVFTSIESDPGGLTLGLGPTGEILSFDRPAPTPKDPAPPRPEAQARAVEALAALGVSLDGFTVRADKDDGVQINAPGGTTVHVREGDEEGEKDVEVHVGNDGPPTDPGSPEDPSAKREETFTWERLDAKRPGVRHLVTATMTSAGLDSFVRKVRFDAAEPERSDVGAVVEGTTVVFFVLGIVLALFGIGVFRLASRDFVNFRRALGALLVFTFLCFVAIALQSAFDGSLVAIPFMTFGLAISLGALIMFAWLVGETDAYRGWGKSATEGLLALFTFRPWARQTARETLEGTLLGWLMLGVLTAAAAIVAAVWGPDAVQRGSDLYAVDAHPSVLFSFSLLPEAFAIMVVGHLFLGARAQRAFKRTWIAVPVTGIAVALLAVIPDVTDASFGTLPQTLSWALGFGLLTSAVARRGVLTAGVATFVLMAFYYGLAAVTCGATGDAVWASLGLALASAPAALAFALGPSLPEVEIREAPTTRMTSMLEQARRHEELNIAHRVQSGLLPSVDPEVEGFDVSGACLPANEVGGDYFDYFRLANGGFGVAVGDVSGKGVPAAFFMTLTKGFMEVAAEETCEPADALALANTYLRDTLAKGTFVTMAYAVLDPESRVVAWARAGHNLPALARMGAPAELVDAPGVALGAAGPEEFGRLIRGERIELRRGDALVFYTDGLTEAMNPAREQFGEERLLSALDRLRDGVPARDLVAALVEEVRAFSHGAPQHDDITIVVIRAA